jgi:iron-sulfur cluster insertion protein
MVVLTEKAVVEIKRIAVEKELDLEKTYLRVRITGGGCSGFQAKLDLDETVDENKDLFFVESGVKIAIDKRSALYLDDTKIDFIDDLNKHGFHVDIPAAKSKCGCGSSFSM